ncbi:suppressor APC domain-containing protein 2 isoform X1 [Harpegnathos saltator]|uniref:suppressor APC domain-containing protein 2 isoform X1 n=1 Tax=Harpegnathos saltator TaxID=610380 RepID=UPI00058F3AB8|nr:suppressor APC domain-containing protein 2 isoform X1 [Harpegnathos saltator]XP_011148354.1 suppressor APC domain-containing protein 2 isoform X1 [Harpegnathos saltator]XP_011148361.1 suppressor APC domain-containing protein 2 isoform X1 [Harpegnathos saltator]
MAQIQTSTMDGLPKHFVNAMRTLFDIMDDQNTGYVKFVDIEGRWQDDGTQGLPKGVLDSLKRVTPPNGMLSFERFCAGLKICLLQIQTEANSKKHDGQPNRPPSAPILIPDSQNKAAWTSPNTAAIRPNNAISQQRTLSMPQLLANRKDMNVQQLELMDGRNIGEPKINKVYGPPKPPRTGAALEGRTQLGADRNFDKSEIRTALQNWQMGLMMSDEKAVEKRQLQTVNYRPDARTLLRPTRALGDGKAVDMQSNQLVLQPKKPSNRRREPRRHTLQNGIDYNMMKRMKQIEQEKDVLLQGLAAVDKAREWYLKQISATQEKIKHLGRMGSHVEQWTEAQQERLELQRARVLEVNRHLAALISSWERGGLPLHMNLAFLSIPTSTQLQQDMLSRLKQQNHRLTEEVSKKSQRIALLEQEKDSLVRELYNRQPGLVQSRRATMIHEQHDQTFII